MNHIAIMKTTAKSICALALAAAMSLPFASCEKKPQPGPEPGPEPEPEISIPANTVVLDGTDYPVVSATIDRNRFEDSDCQYYVFLYLNEDKMSFVKFQLHAASYDGKTLDLTKLIDGGQGTYIPEIIMKMNNTPLFYSCLAEGSGPAFDSGTLYIKRLGVGTDFEIILTDGRITDNSGEKYGDGKEHKIAVNYKGSLTLDSPAEGGEGGGGGTLP